MGKNKPRKYPDKPQNNYPIPCPRYEEIQGNPYCHGGNGIDACTCKGNPHNCVKTYYKRAASRSNAQINNGDYRRK